MQIENGIVKQEIRNFPYDMKPVKAGRKKREATNLIALFSDRLLRIIIA